MSSETRTEPIKLIYSEGNTQVVIEPEDQDRFVLRVEEAIRACRVYDEFRSLFEKQLDHLKNMLGGWLRQQHEKTQKAFLTLQDDRMLFVVVMARKEYDPDLEKDLTELELRIAQDQECSQINLDVQALPSCDEHCYESFCNPTWTLEYVKPDA